MIPETMSATNKKVKLTSTESDGRDGLLNLYLRVLITIDFAKGDEAELERKVKKAKPKYSYYVHETDLERVAGGVAGVRLALQKVEELAQCLYRCPWKKELYTLKFHGVLIRNYLQPALTNYHVLLRKLGYEMEKDKFVLDIPSEMRKEGHISSSVNEYLYIAFRDKVLKIAFDLYTLKLNEKENDHTKFIVPAPSKGHSVHGSFSNNTQYHLTNPHNNFGSDMYGRNESDAYNNQGQDFDFRNSGADDLQISNIKTIVNNVNPIITEPLSRNSYQEEKRKKQSNKVTSHGFVEHNLTEKEREIRTIQPHEAVYQEEKRKKQSLKPISHKFGENKLAGKEQERRMIHPQETESNTFDKPNMTPNKQEVSKKQFSEDPSVSVSTKKYINELEKCESRKLIVDMLFNKIQKEGSVEEKEKNMKDGNVTFPNINVQNTCNFGVQANCMGYDNKEGLVSNTKLGRQKSREKMSSLPDSSESIEISHKGQPRTQTHIESNSEHLKEIEVPVPANNGAYNQKEDLAGNTELRRGKKTEEEVQREHQTQTPGESNNKYVGAIGEPENNRNYIRKQNSGDNPKDVSLCKTEFKVKTNNLKPGEMLGLRLNDSSTPRKHTTSFLMETGSTGHQTPLSRSKVSTSFDHSEGKQKQTNEKPNDHPSKVQNYDTTRSRSDTKTSMYASYVTSCDSNSVTNISVKSKAKHYSSISSTSGTGSVSLNECEHCHTRDGFLYICHVCSQERPICDKCLKKQHKCTKNTMGGYHIYKRFCHETNV